MTGVRQTQKKYGSAAMTVAIAVGVALMLAGYKPIAKGLILGALCSVINFVLIGESLPYRLQLSSRRRVFAALGSICIRYGILAGALIAAVRSDAVDVVAVVLGIFMVQGIILTEHLLGAVGVLRKPQP
jgi:hypothetical protein